MTDRKTATMRQVKRARTLGLLAPVFAIAFGFAFTVTVDWQGDTLTMSSAYAKGGGNGGGNSGGNGGGNGRGNAPGQAGEDVASDDLGLGADSVEATASDGRQDDVEAGVPQIADETAPASMLVIKELAGLPENSALSEEEELEAIRSGWGTWRTADGPDTIMAQ